MTISSSLSGYNHTLATHTMATHTGYIHDGYTHGRRKRERLRETHTGDYMMKT